MKLEELARSSSAAARTSVSHLDLPPIGERSPARPWIPVLAGAGVAAALVAGLTFVASNRSADESTPADQVPAVVEVPNLALPSDSGWTVTFAADGAAFAAERGLSNPEFTYYGTTGTDDPFGAGDLLIASYEASPGAESETMPGTEFVEVRGVTGRLGADADSGLPADSLSLEWIEQGGGDGALQVILVSRSLDRERLLAVAEALTIDTTTGTITPSIDLDLERLLSASGTPLARFGTSTEGSLIAYERGGESAVLSTGRGDVEREAIPLRWWFPSVEDVTIGDRPGLSAELPGTQPGDMTIWSPVDGIVASLTYLGDDPTFDLVATAESVIELDDAAWEALVAEYGTESTARITSNYDEIFAEESGEIDGVRYSWVLGLQADDLCFDLESGGGFGMCQPRSGIAPPPDSAVTIDNSFGDQIAEVLIAADPAVDDVVEVEGRYIITRIEADGLSWFVAIGDPTVQPSFEVIVAGEAVDVLEAGVEVSAIAEQSLGDVRAAVEAGVDDMDVFLFDQTDAVFPRWIGSRAGDICLVTGEPSSTAACSPAGDIVVFRPVAGSGGPVTFVVAVEPPECVVDVAISGESYISTSAENETGRYWVVSGEGGAEGWELDLVVGGAVASVALPAEGQTSYPAGLCEG